MSNLLEEAICSSDGERAARILQQAAGIESDDVAGLGAECTNFPNEVRETRLRLLMS
jgi:hypothetical protein